MRLTLRRLLPGDEEAFRRAVALTAMGDPTFAHYYRPELARLTMWSTARRFLG